MAISRHGAVILHACPLAFTLSTLLTNVSRTTEIKYVIKINNSSVEVFAAKP